MEDEQRSWNLVRSHSQTGEQISALVERLDEEGREDDPRGELGRDSSRPLL